MGERPWLISVGVAILASGALLSLAATARAQEMSAAPRDVARAHFQKGLTLADAGRFEEAVAEFQDAYRLSPQPAVLFNMAVAAANARRPALALGYFREYLNSAGTKADPQRVRDARERIAQLSTIVARLEVIAEPGHAQVLLDGQPLTYPAEVDPGEHTLTVTARGYEPVAQSLRCAQGERREVKVKLAALRESPPKVSHSVLLLSCAVPDVRVTVDGRARVTTGDATPVSVAPGEHRISFERAGYRSQELGVDARPDEITRVDCDLRVASPLPPSQSSFLRLRSLGPHARAFLNGAAFEGQGWVPTGRHILRVERSGYSDWMTTVDLAPRQTLEVTPLATPTPAAVQRREQERRKRLWVSGALGSAGLILGGVTTWLVIDNASRFDTWQTEQRRLDAQWRSATAATAPTGAQQANDDRADRIKLQDELAVGAGVAAGALLLAGGVLFFSDGGETSLTANIAPHHAGTTLRLTFE